MEERRSRQAPDADPRRQGRRHRHLDLAGGRRRQPQQAAGHARRRQGHEGARRQPRDGHDVQGRRRLGAVAAVERDLRGDADRRDGRGADVVDQPHLVPPGGSVEGADQRPRQVVLVHVRAADDVEAGVRQAAEGAAGRDHVGGRRPREVRGRRRQGRRHRGRRASTPRRARRSPTSTTRRSRKWQALARSRCGRTTPTRTRTARSCSRCRRSCCDVPRAGRDHGRRRAANRAAVARGAVAARSARSSGRWRASTASCCSSAWSRWSSRRSC